MFCVLSQDIFALVFWRVCLFICFVGVLFVSLFLSCFVFPSVDHWILQVLKITLIILTFFSYLFFLFFLMGEEGVVAAFSENKTCLEMKNVFVYMLVFSSHSCFTVLLQKPQRRDFFSLLFHSCGFFGQYSDKPTCLFLNSLSMIFQNSLWALFQFIAFWQLP